MPHPASAAPSPRWAMSSRAAASIFSGPSCGDPRRGQCRHVPSTRCKNSRRVANSEICPSESGVSASVAFFHGCLLWFLRTFLSPVFACFFFLGGGGSENATLFMFFGWGGGGWVVSPTQTLGNLDLEPSPSACTRPARDAKHQDILRNTTGRGPMNKPLVRVLGNDHFCDTTKRA